MIDQARPSEYETEEYPDTGQYPVHGNSYHPHPARITRTVIK